MLGSQGHSAGLVRIWLQDAADRRPTIELYLASTEKYEAERTQTVPFRMVVSRLPSALLREMEHSPPAETAGSGVFNRNR